MQAIEKNQIDAVQSLYNSANKLKLKIKNLYEKVEIQQEACNWPSYLSSLAICASELSEIRKLTESERFSHASGMVITPIFLNPDPDPALSSATEDRVTVLNHESVPQYLRTKLDPFVENQCNVQNTKATKNYTEDQIQKMIAATNKAIDSSLKEINHLKQDIESDFNAVDNFNKPELPAKGSKVPSSEEALAELHAYVLVGKNSGNHYNYMQNK